MRVERKFVAKDEDGERYSINVVRLDNGLTELWAEGGHRVTRVEKGVYDLIRGSEVPIRLISDSPSAP